MRWCSFVEYVLEWEEVVHDRHTKDQEGLQEVEILGMFQVRPFSAVRFLFLNLSSREAKKGHSIPKKQNIPVEQMTVEVSLAHLTNRHKALPFHPEMPR